MALTSMNPLPAGLTRWIKNHTAAAHTLTLVWLFLQGAYAENPAFHDGVNQTVMTVYHALPHWFSGAIGTLIMPLFVYWNTQRKATVTAEVAPGETGTAAATAVVAKPAASTAAAAASAPPKPPAAN